MVGGVLMERTVADVMPSLETNLEGIAGIVRGLAQQYEKKVRLVFLEFCHQPP